MDEANVGMITLIGLIVNLFSAHIDIVMSGWSVSLFRPENL